MKNANACVGLAILCWMSMASAQVTGSGTKYVVPVWTGPSALGNSAIVSAGGNVGIGTGNQAPHAKLEVDTAATTGIGISANATATTGSPSAIFASTSAPQGAAITAVASSNTGNQVAIAATTNSPTGTAIFAHSATTTGPSNAITAVTDGEGGAVANFTATNSSSNASGGIYVVTTGPYAIPGTFISQGFGNLLLGQVGSTLTDVFRVDGTGKGFFDGGTQTGGADFAESVAIARGTDRHEPGDLLIVDTTAKRQLKLATEPYSTLVAGIYSTKPGVLATPHKMGESAVNEIPLAIVGIVPCKVSAENGAIQPGDLLVSSSTLGHAMKGTDRSKMLGAVVGKALEPLTEGKGVIQVLVTLQ